MLGRVFVLGDDPPMLKVWLNGASADLVDGMPDNVAGAAITKKIENARPSAKGKLNFLHMFSWQKNPIARGIYDHIGIRPRTAPRCSFKISGPTPPFCRRTSGAGKFGHGRCAGNRRAGGDNCPGTFRPILKPPLWTNVAVIKGSHKEKPPKRSGFFPLLPLEQDYLNIALRRIPNCLLSRRPTRAPSRVKSKKPPGRLRVPKLVSAKFWAVVGAVSLNRFVAKNSGPKFSPRRPSRGLTSVAD